MARIVGITLAVGAILVGCGSSGRDELQATPNASDSVGGQLGGETGAGGVRTGGVGGAGGLASIGGLGGGAGVGDAAGSAGNGGQSAGEQAGDAGTGGAAGAPMFPPRPICGGSISSGNEVWCEGIENVALSRGALTDASGDGRVSPGEEASVVIVMRNDGAKSYSYPCVGLLAGDPAVTILGGEAHDNPAWDFFGILQGQSLEVTMSFRVETSIAPGTKVRFVAWLDVLKAGCANGNEIEFDVDVE